MLKEQIVKLNEESIEGSQKENLGNSKDDNITITSHRNISYEGMDHQLPKPTK